MKGQIHIYTGDSKGKTTAALGLLIRAFGNGLKVAIVYFDKGGFNYGERVILKQLKIPFFVTGVDRRDKNGKFRFGVIDKDIQEAYRGLNIVKDLFKDNYDLIVCDEINVTTDLKMLKESDVLDLIDNKPKNLELILTGRYAPQSFKDKATLITEMKLHKHYFNDGVPARKGIEY